MSKTKMFITGIELSDIKRVVEEVLTINLKRLESNAEEMLTLLTRENTAKLLSISLPTLSQWTKDGTIRGHRIGYRVLYKLEDINSSLNVIETKSKRGGKSC